MFPILNTLKSFLLIVITLLCFNNPTLFAQVSYEEDLTVIEHDVGFLLIWSTSSETNNHFFAIERSLNEGPFETIGSVNSKSTGSITAYKYTDLDLGLKKVRYRLKQVSKDGIYSYSNEVTKEKIFVCHFKVVKKEKLTNEVFQVTINSIKEGDLEYRLTNDLGDVLLEELKAIDEGLNDYVLDFQSEVDGTYHLFFKVGPEIESVYFKKETKDKKGNVAKKKAAGSSGG